MLSTVYFVLDNIMYWEAFRWERLDKGHIYMQKFPKGKLYAGQTTNLVQRFSKYIKLQGSNPHHTNALKKYGWNNVIVSHVLCPKYLLDTIEIFLIGAFDLTDSRKGYNKTTGGRKGYYMSKETRSIMSQKMSGENNPMYGKSHTEESRSKISGRMSGENHPLFGKGHTNESRVIMSIAKSGENHPFFGKIRPEETRAKISESKLGNSQTEETRAKISEKMIGENNHMYGKSHTEESRAAISEKLSGENNVKSKPICVFGKLYGAASTASNTLREVCDTTSKGNFMKNWVHHKKHQHNVFYVSKNFYLVMKDYTGYITHDMYTNWTTTADTDISL